MSMTFKSTSYSDAVQKIKKVSTHPTVSFYFEEFSVNGLRVEHDLRFNERNKYGIGKEERKIGKRCNRIRYEQHLIFGDQ